MSLIYTKTTSDPLHYLPHELCLLILEQLDPISLAMVGRVNRHWSAFSSLDCLWRRHYAQAIWYSARSRSNANTLRNFAPSWKSIFGAHHTLERHWSAGKYSTFTIKIGFQVTSIRQQGHKLFTGDNVGTILCWDLTTHSLIGQPFCAIDSSEVRCIEVDPLYADTVIMCGHRNGSLSIWHVPSRKKLHHLKAHDLSIETISLGNRFIVTASMDKTIKVWTRSVHFEVHVLSTFSGSVPLLKPMCTLIGHTALVSAVSIADNASTLKSFSPGDQTIRKWDLMTRCCTSIFTCPGAVSCSHLDGQRLCIRGRLRLWEEGQDEFGQVLQDSERVTLAAQGLWRNGLLQRLVTVGRGGCILWEWNGDVKQWRQLYRLMDSSELLHEGPEAIKRQTLRYCEVNETRIISCSGPRVIVWDFGQLVNQRLDQRSPFI